MENDMVYDDIDGLEEMLLEVNVSMLDEVLYFRNNTVRSQLFSYPQNFRDKHSTSASASNDHNNSVDNSSETMSTNSANSPVPLSHQNSHGGGGGSANHSNHSRGGAGGDDSDAKRRHKSASEDGGKVREYERDVIVAGEQILNHAVFHPGLGEQDHDVSQL